MGKTKKGKTLFLGLFLIILGGVGFYFFGSRQFQVNRLRTEKSDLGLITYQNVSPLSGISCKDYKRRPFAVILAEDEIVRPLSGLGEADLVIEMPVISGGMNRFMAVYVCANPSEIGSVRSARHDFISLAMGLDAIFAHWGGSHFALDKLRKGIIDNIDALSNPGKAFWRKKDIPAPHNGFTNIERLTEAAKKLGYRLESRFEGYPHRPPKNFTREPAATLEIGYPGIYKVRWEYNPKTNSYLRWRGGKPEKDKLTGRQVRAKNVVVMRASSRQIEGQYNDVDVEGEGKLSVYLDGEVIKGKWKKEGHYQDTKLYFYDQKGKEIKFQPGQIWIEIIEPEREVIYSEFRR